MKGRSPEDRNLLEKKARSYKRNHTGDCFGDAERSKIQRDRELALRSDKALDRAWNAADADEAYESMAEALHASQKAHGNFKTHQNRLKELSGHEDFQ